MDELRLVVRDAKNEADLKQRLDAWVQEHSKDSLLSDMIFGPALQAELAGQLMVDVNDSKTIELTRSGQLWLFQQKTPAFLDLQWTEAIDLYKQLEAEGKIPRNKEFANRFSTLLQQYGKRGDVDRELFLERMRKFSLQKVLSALEEGTTFKEFADDFDDFTNSLGVGYENPSYLETVFRTNLQTSYGAGRQRALQAVADERPYWQYRTVNDGRVRPEHEVLHNKIFQHGNPKTDILFPPNGFNCRCAAVTMHPDDIPEGFKPLTAPPTGFKADPGFSAQPTEMISAVGD